MNYAMIFPGQGSQAVGMLAGLDAAAVAATFDEASTALGWDVAALVREGPAERLNQTEFTQPALLAAGIAVWRVWSARSLPPPVALAGHSLGEYTALVAANALGFADALRLVQLRGQLMQAAVPEGQGGMAAVIGLEDAQVEALCRAAPAGAVLEPVNYNAPGQVVVAGARSALDWLEANGKAQGARMIMRLPVSVPSHCSLMTGAAQKLGEALAAVKIHTPAIPVLHNLDAHSRSGADEIRAALQAQLHRPVRWTQTMEALAAQGVNLFLECGPGKVLCGLNKRILKQAQSVALEETAGLDKAQALLSGS